MASYRTRNPRQLIDNFSKLQLLLDPFSVARRFIMDS